MSPVLADVLGRAVRNTVQVLLPLLALVSSGNITGADAAAVTVAGALAFVTSLGKSLLDWKASPDSPLLLRVLDRVAAAAVGAALALVPTDLAGALSADWRVIGLAAAGAAATSFAMWLLEVLPAEQAAA